MEHTQFSMFNYTNPLEIKTDRGSLIEGYV